MQCDAWAIQWVPAALPEYVDIAVLAVINNAWTLLVIFPGSPEYADIGYAAKSRSAAYYSAVGLTRSVMAFVAAGVLLAWECHALRHPATQSTPFALRIEKGKKAIPIRTRSLSKSDERRQGAARAGHRWNA